jgi:hypothetical protein
MSSINPPPHTHSSDNPQSDRARAFLELADAAAIAHNSFRLMADEACLEPEFRDIPFCDENMGAVGNRIDGFVNDRVRVLKAVFLDDPEAVVQSCCLVLPAAFQPRGIHSPELMQRVQHFIQAFFDLRGRPHWPGVNLTGVGWENLRESYAFDGECLAAYAEHRNGILAPLNIHEIDIIRRNRCFTLHHSAWPRRYATDDLVRMAEAAHRVLSNPATAVPEAPPGPLPAAPTAASPSARFPHYDDYLPPGFANPPEDEWPCANARRAEFGRSLNAANRKLVPAGARLPDAFYTYWTRRWADGFWRATQLGRPSLEGVRALIDFGDVIDAEFRLNNRHGVEPSDVEFTYYDRDPLRGAEGRPFPLGSHGKTLENAKHVSPDTFPRLAAPAPAITPRIGCEEFLVWAGFLADDAALTPELWADLNRVGVDVGSWCVANGGDMTDCQRIADNLVNVLRRQTDAVAEERKIDYAFGLEVCNLQNVLRTVKQWMRRVQSSTQAMASIQLVPAEENIPYDLLMHFARTELVGKERAVIEALCEAGGRILKSSLGVKQGVDWDDADEGFRNAQRRLNPKIQPLGYRLESEKPYVTLRTIGAKAGAN